MQRKLFDASLIVLGTAVAARLLLVTGLRVPHDFPRYVNALVLLATACVISLGLTVLLPRLQWPRSLSPALHAPLKIIAALVGAWLVVAVVFYSYGFVKGYSSRPSTPQVTWDDQGK